MSATNPEIAKQWHPIKNGKLTPFKVSGGSSKKVWWKCDKNENHEWEALIKSRVNGSNCPICQNRKTEISNCLITTNPEIAKQWHPTKNGTLTPNDVTAGSKKKIWWTCDKGPDHIWRAALEKRLKGSDCPACSGKKTVLSNCLATTNPEIAQQWHPTKNGKLTPFDFTSGSGMKVWWKCPIGDDHEWESVILNRKQGNGCPICSNKAVVDSNCLAKTNPIIAQQWHPTKNGLLTPYHFVSNSNVKVWWKCDKGDDHEWESLISNRVKGKGCPVCSGRKAVLSNCLATLNPEIAKQWHPTKNVDLTPYDVKVQSNIKVWWLCNKNDTHEWKTLVGVRFRGSGCPYCVLTPQSRQELTITFELIQFFEDINPKGLKLKVKNKIWSIDIFIPELNLGIEFDGSFWHKDKQEFDLLKTSELHKLGYNIIRVREAPLTKITDNDIITKQPFNGKTITNEILKQITKLYLLDNTKLKQINKYLTKNDLQNENELDDYIERILIEKAELDKQKRKYRSTT